MKAFNATWRIAIILAGLIWIRAVDARAQSDPKSYVWPTDERTLASLQRWQDYKFGLLIHEGLYSQLGIVESWELCPEDWVQRPGYDDYFAFARDYRNTKAKFNPTKFDPAKWARAFHAAGARYVIYTTKHHDGFCMFDTKLTDFKVTDAGCPFSTNVRSNMALEVFNACRAEGLAVGAYFSKPDWSSSNFWWSYYPPKDRNPSYDTTKYPERWRAFVKYTQGQLDELVSGYGPLDILWLDGCWVRPLSTINEGVAEFCKYPHDLDIDMKSIAANARRRQPGILIVDRWVQGEFENYLTPEQKIPAQPLSAPWESCITLGGAWGWVPHDRFKSSREVIQMLVRIVAKGGNLLLGIGPDGQGEFDPVIYQRLAEIGKWLQMNGEAIYGSRPVAPFQDGKVAYTAQGRESIYAIYLPEKNETQWPAEVSIKTDLPGPYDVGVPALREKISYRMGDGGVIAEIPASLRNRAAQEPALVIRLRHAASAPDH